MMRHVGMSRDQIVAMLAIEGRAPRAGRHGGGQRSRDRASQILIHVINPSTGR